MNLPSFLSLFFIFWCWLCSLQLNHCEHKRCCNENELLSDNSSSSTSWENHSLIPTRWFVHCCKTVRTDASFYTNIHCTHTHSSVWIEFLIVLSHHSQLLGPLEWHNNWMFFLVLSITCTYLVGRDACMRHKMTLLWLKQHSDSWDEASWEVMAVCLC